jgi:hypothetical protein
MLVYELSRGVDFVSSLIIDNRSLGQNLVDDIFNIINNFATHHILYKLQIQYGKEDDGK